MNDATAFLDRLALFAVTYLFHSTLLLTTCWLGLRMMRAGSHFLVERMWKLAATLGLAASLLHVTLGSSLTLSWVESWTLATNENAFREVAKEQADQNEQANGESPSVSDQDPATISNDLVTTITYPQEPPAASVAKQPYQNDRAGLPLDRAAATAEDASGPQRDELDPPQSSLRSANGGRLANPPPVVAAGLTHTLLRQVAICIRSLVALTVVGCMLGGGFVLLVQTLRLRTRFATSRPLAEGPARRVVDRFLKRHRIRRRIRLLASSSHHEPITYGLFSWTIVLPEKTEEKLGQEELKALLAHEIAHLVRGDVAWLWVGRLLCTCLAFQPLNVLARRKWQQASEYLCDDWAISRGVRAISLARCLTQIAEWRFGRQACEIGLAAGGPKATLVQRVERLVNAEQPVDKWAQPVARRSLAVAATILVIGLVALTPRFALPFTSSGRLTTSGELAASDVEDTARLQAQWDLLKEELLQLDADLERATTLARTQRQQPQVSQRILELQSQSASLRARRKQITSLLEKDSRR